MRRELYKVRKKDGTDGRIDRRTDGRTPDRYITLNARRVQCSKGVVNINYIKARHTFGLWFLRYGRGQTNKETNIQTR